MPDLPFEVQQALFDRKRSSLDLIAQTAATADYPTVQRVTGIATTWNDIKPGVALALARSGFDAYSPETQQVARLSTQQRALEQGWNRALNRVTTLRDFKQQFGHLTPDEYNQLPAQAQHALTHRAQQLAGQELDEQHGGGILGAVGNAADYVPVVGAVKGIAEGASPGEILTRTLPGAKEVAGVRDLAANAAGNVPGVGQPIKAGVRTTALAANTPLQYVQGLVREKAGSAAALAHGDITLGNVARTIDPTLMTTELTAAPGAAAQTQAGQAVIAKAQGRPVDVGSGYLPSPESATGQAAAQAARGSAPTIGGHAFTLGRFYAGAFGKVTRLYEPNTDAFNILSGIIDGTAAVKVDPTALVLQNIAEARAANKLFVPEMEGGRIPTTGPVDINPRTKEGYLMGQKFTNGPGEQIRTETSPTRIWRLTGEKLPVTTVHGQPLLDNLANATDIDTVRNEIRQATEIIGPLDPPKMTYKLRRGLDTRLLSELETGSLEDPGDKTFNLKVLDNVMKGAGVSMDARDAALDKYIRNPNPIGGLDAVSDTVAESLTAKGVDPKKADQVASFFRRSRINATGYDIDQLTGHERLRPGIGIAGEGYVIPAPSRSTDQLNSGVQLPNGRELRRMSGVAPEITGTKPWEVSQTALAFPASVWKGLSLLSIRMAARVFGDTQGLMAIYGMDNAFTHPTRFASLLMGLHPDSAMTQWLSKLPGLDPAYIRTPEIQALFADQKELFMNASQFVQGPETTATRGYVDVPIRDDRAAAGLAEQLSKSHNDPIWKGVAEAETPEAAHDWFWDGPGKGLRIKRAPTVQTQDEWMMQRAAEDPTIRYPEPIGDIVNDRQAADRYIDHVVYPSIHDLTGGGNQELMDAIRTGKLGGVDITKMPGKDWSQASIHADAEARARELLDAGEGPQRSVLVREQLPAMSSTSSKGAAYLRHAFDWLFHGLVDVPDHLVNREPAYIQKFWEKAGNLLPYADPEAHNRILTLAEESAVPKDVLNRLRTTVVDGSTSERLDYDQLKRLAKANALDDIKNIVHDLSSRSQFFDMTRMLVPFGDAFRLVAQRWLTALAEQPNLARRVQQGIQAVQAEGSGAVNRALGDPVPSGEGFFHHDANGQQVFSYPGSTWFDHTLLGTHIPLLKTGGAGVDMPMVGDVKGLSFVGEGYPGLGGPTLTLPAKWLLPHTPTGDRLRQVIFPYGGGEGSGNIFGDIGRTFEPSWFRKVFDGPVDQRSFNTAVGAQMAALANSGDYDLQGPNAKEDTQRLIHDATANARWMYVVAGVGNFVTPGAPRTEPGVRDLDGRWAVLQVVSQKYHDKVQKEGPGPAFQWLINNFGTKGLFIAQKASQATGYAAPVTKEAQAWVDSHPSISEKYPLTYGLFAPTKGTFDITTYGEQFKKGERTSLTGAQQVAQAENRLGFFIYDRIQQALVEKNGGGPLTNDQHDKLTAIRAAIKDEYPGFDTYTASPYDTAKRRTQAIDEISDAVKDPAISETDAGQGVTQYLALRTAALTAAPKYGAKTPFQAKSALVLRNMLRAGADTIINDHPDFRIIWDTIFSRELARDGQP